MTAPIKPDSTKKDQRRVGHTPLRPVPLAPYPHTEPAIPLRPYTHRERVVPLRPYQHVEPIVPFSERLPKMGVPDRIGHVVDSLRNSKK